MKNNSIWHRYSYLWVTGAFFLFSIIGHWTFAWFAYVEDQQTHNEPVEINSFAIETTRDTMENWQSEMLQLLWQVAGLSFLLSIGSPQSKEGDDRKEEKLDAILLAVDKNGDKLIDQLDQKYQRR